MFRLCGASDQDVINVHAHTWYALEQTLHDTLKYGWCRGHPKWKSLVSEETPVCVDGDELT